MACSPKPQSPATSLLEVPIKQVSISLEALKYEAFSSVYDSVFQRLQHNNGFSGTVLVAEQGKILHTAAYGLANLANKDSISIHSNFQLASVSKMFTATAIMMLYEAGRLDFDDAVCEYLAEFPYDDISIRHLLNHRSGLCRYMALADEHWDAQKPLSNRDVLCLFMEHRPNLWFSPGKKFNYINSNYALLALIVEEVSGQSFDQFLEKHIFEPLDMENTLAYTELTKPAIPNLARGYTRRWRRYIDVRPDYLDGVMGDKGVYSNILDLYRFDQALYTDRLMSRQTQKEAFKPGSPELQTHNYGFGYRMKTRYPDLVYHFGWWRGYISCFMRDLKQQKTLIILCNRDNLRRSLNFWEIFCLEDHTSAIFNAENEIILP